MCVSNKGVQCAHLLPSLLKVSAISSHCCGRKLTISQWYTQTQYKVHLPQVAVHLFLTAPYPSHSSLPLPATRLESYIEDHLKINRHTSHLTFSKSSLSSWSRMELAMSCSSTTLCLSSLLSRSCSGLYLHRWRGALFVTCLRTGPIS